MSTKFKIVQEISTGKKFLSKTHFISSDKQFYFAEVKNEKMPNFKKIKEWGLGYGEYNDDLIFIGEVEIENGYFDWNRGYSYSE